MTIINNLLNIVSLNDMGLGVWLYMYVHISINASTFGTSPQAIHTSPLDVTALDVRLHGGVVTED